MASQERLGVRCETCAVCVVTVWLAEGVKVNCTPFPFVLVCFAANMARMGPKYPRNHLPVVQGRSNPGV